MRTACCILWFALAAAPRAATNSGSGLSEASPPGFSSPALPHTTSWVGNTYPGVPKWVQQDIRAMAVTPEGTVFSNVEWEEGGGNVGEYRDGELVRYARHTHGWGAGGGLSVAANARYVFLGLAMGNEGGGLKDEQTWPPKGLKWFGVSRRLRSDLAVPAPFAGGKGGKGDTLKDSFLVVAEVAERGGAPLAGMAATETELFVSDPNAGEIKVFDCETMALTQRWKVDRAGPLAMDRWGGLAMLEAPTNSSPQRVLFFGRGQEPSMEARLPAGTIPSAVCFRDNRLLVADIGPEQQILVFAPVPNSRAMTLVERIGERGGIFAAKGAFGDLRFNDVRALGCDTNGNLYVAQDGQTGGGGTVLESYSGGTGKLNWRLFGLTFVDLADADPVSDTDVYTKEEHFQLDYSQPAGREWHYAGYTVDRFQHPQDPRLHIWSADAWVRRIGGQRILFVNDMNGEHLQVFRFDAQAHGEIAIPAGLFAKRHLADPRDSAWPPHQPAHGEWIWRDANGDGAFDEGEFSQPAPGGKGGGKAEIADAPASQGWWVDTAGNVWLTTETKGIRFFPQAGLDTKGNPVWSFTGMRTFDPPPEFEQIKRIRYLPESDTLLLAGTTAEHRNQHWKPGGPVLARYDGWLKGGRALRWQIVVPYATGSQGHSSCESMGFDVAGDFIFVPYTGASRPDNVKHGRVEVFRAGDGSPVGHLEPDADVGEIGLQDIRECLTARRRADGEYIVFLEDDYKSKVVMYRLKLEAGAAAGPAAGIEVRKQFIPAFAVKYGGSTGWPALEDAARFNLLAIGAGTSRNRAHATIPGNTWQVLKTLNPSQVLLLYEIGPGEYNAATWGRLGQGWEWIKAQHGPGSKDRWTAIGLKSGQCLQGSAYSNERLMVPGNAAWQQYWLDNVYARNWADPAKATAVADGVFSDNSSYTMPWVGGWYREGHADQPDVPADYYSNNVYQAGLYHPQIKSFFARAIPWLTTRKLKLALNFGDMPRRPEDWKELDEERSAPVAAMEEGAFVHPWGGKGSFVFRSEKEWLTQVAVMRRLKHVCALMNVHGPVSGEAKGLERMDSRDAAGNRAWDVLWYALATFLQGINEERSNAAMNFTVWGYLEFHWFKEFDSRFLHLGRVRGESNRIEGRQGHVYVREFEDGWAVVNPTAQPALGIAVPEGEARVVDHDTLEQPQARPLVRQFDLPAHRGIVLLKAGRAIGNTDNP